jgi:hypothetical protein
MGKVDASIRSIQNVVRSNAKDLVFQVVKHWVEGVTKPKIYQVIISGIRSSEASKIQNFLASIGGVQNVFRRSFNQGTAELEVETGSVQSTIVDALESFEGIPIELVSEEPFRMSFRKIKGEEHPNNDAQGK